MTSLTSVYLPLFSSTVPIKNCKVKTFGEQKLVRGNCTSMKSYTVTGCMGMCESKAQASLGLNNFNKLCSCCQPVAIKNEKVPMVCSDGKPSYEVSLFDPR